MKSRGGRDMSNSDEVLDNKLSKNNIVILILTLREEELLRSQLQLRTVPLVHHSKLEQVAWVVL